MSLTPLEESSLEAFLILRDTLSAGKPMRKLEYLDVMTVIRNMVVSLENAKYGCPLGRHSGSCKCKAEPMDQIDDE